MNLVAAITTSTLGVLAAVHVYWAFGGSAGIRGTVPTVDGKPVFEPGRTATLLVALGLALLATTAALSRSPALMNVDGQSSLRYANRLAAGLFLARAIGDFRLVGFFKRIRGTRFARLDTLVYSPLCLLLALAFWLLSAKP